MHSRSILQKTKWYNLGFEFCVYAIVFFVPIIFSEDFFLSFEIPKIFIFRFFLYIAAIFFVFKVLIEKKLEIPDIFRNKFFKIFLILIPLVFTLSTTFSIAPNVSFWGSYYRQEGLFSYIHFFAFFILLLLNFRKEHFIRALKVAIAAFGVTLIYGLAQSFGFYMGGFNIDSFLGRNFSSFGHPNFFGSYIIIMFFPLVSLAISSFKKRAEATLTIPNFRNRTWVTSAIPSFKNRHWGTFLIYCLLIALSLINLILNKGRASILGLFAGIFVYLLILGIYQSRAGNFKKTRNLKKKLIALALVPPILLALLVGSVNIFKNVEFIHNNTISSRFILEGENLRSIETRIIMWPSVIEMAKSRPILGYGPDTFALGYGPFMQKELLLVENFTDIPDRTHNLILQWLVDFGFTGLCILVAFIIWLFSFSIKKIFTIKNDFLPPISILCAFTSILISHQFGFSANEHLIFLFFFAAFLFAILSKDYDTKILPKCFNNKNVSALIVSIILTSLAVTLIPTNFFFAYGDREFSKGYAGVNNGDFFDSLKDLVDAETFYPHTNFYKYIIGSVYLSLADTVTDDKDTRKKTLETALNFAQRADNFSSGNDGMNHLLLAKIYSKYSEVNNPNNNLKDQLNKQPQPQNPKSKNQPTRQDQPADLKLTNTQTPLQSNLQTPSRQEYLALSKQEFATAKELMPLYPNIYLEEGKFYFTTSTINKTGNIPQAPDTSLQKAIDLFEFYLNLSPKDWQYKEDKDPTNRNKYRLFYKANPTFNEVFDYLTKAYEQIGNNKKSDYYKRFL